MDKIALIKAEIERRMKILREDEVVRQNCTSDFLEGKIYGYEEVLSFLSTIESEKPMNPDLEKELARFYLKDLCGSEKDEIPEATLHHNFPIMWDDLRDIARHFAEWQSKQDKETIELAEDHAYLAGAVNEREKMIKEAVEGEIVKDNRGNNVVRAGAFNKDFEYGDKVRVIVLPKETERIPKPELTWEDIKEIQRLLDVVWSEQDITAPIDEDTIYKEALKRFKEAKK